jgi:hypothetical protein
MPASTVFIKMKEDLYEREEAYGLHPVPKTPSLVF